MPATAGSYLYHPLTPKVLKNVYVTNYILAFFSPIKFRTSIFPAGRTRFENKLKCLAYHQVENHCYKRSKIPCYKWIRCCNSELLCLTINYENFNEI